jgi:diguanylate cyclase (GGDEF)-like protein
VVGFVIVVALINVCVGYGLAVFFGYGPPGLRAAWVAMGSLPAARGAAASRGPLDALEQQIKAQSNSASATLPADLDEQHVETLILQLQAAAMRSGPRLAEIEQRLRAFPESDGRQTILACRDDLRQDCRDYLEQQRQSAARLHERLSEFGPLAAMGQEIETATLEQVVETETVLAALERMDISADPRLSAAQLLTEIGTLRTARHRLRDRQDGAFLAVARREERLDLVDESLKQDPLTGLVNRIGLETALWSWWKEGFHQAHVLCAALFDVNGFAQLNSDYGSARGDQVLREIGQKLRQWNQPVDLVGRYAGNRFLVVVIDRDEPTAARHAEQTRQLIEALLPCDASRQERPTVQMANGRFAADDTPAALLARLETTLDEARGSLAIGEPVAVDA